MACVCLGVADVRAEQPEPTDAPADAPDAGPDVGPEEPAPDAPPAMSEAEAKAAARKLLDGGDGFLVHHLFHERVFGVSPGILAFGVCDQLLKRGDVAILDLPGARPV